MKPHLGLDRRNFLLSAAGGSALAGAGDYTATNGTLTFLAGVTEQTIVVTVNGDAIVDGRAQSEPDIALEQDDVHTIMRTDQNTTLHLLLPDYR